MKKILSVVVMMTMVLVMVGCTSVGKTKEVLTKAAMPAPASAPVSQVETKQIRERVILTRAEVDDWIPARPLGSLQEKGYTIEDDLKKAGFKVTRCQKILNINATNWHKREELEVTWESMDMVFMQRIWWAGERRLAIRTVSYDKLHKEDELAALQALTEERP
jgi:hypothetical protein